MFRTVVAAMMIAVIVGVAGLLLVPMVAAQSSPMATRSFDNMTVEPGADVQVTIAVANYGGAGAISEMLPPGFTYKTSSLTRRGSGQELRFILTTQSSLTYTATASSVENDYTFSGVLKRVGETDFPIGGAASVTVEAASGSPPMATRSFDNMTVEPGADVQVTIAVANYGGAGAISEMLPPGFTYKTSSLTRRGSGQELRFILTTQSSLTYTATASSVENDYTFSGVLKRVGETDFPIGGAASVTVEAASGSPPMATRSFDNMTVEPGADVQVTIAVANYGGAGAISEMLPPGFTYKTSSLTRRGSGQELRFILTTQSSLTYTATASIVENDYTFSGVLKRVGETDFPISGASSIRVARPSTGGGGGGGGGGSTPPANRAPVFSEGSSASRSVDENSPPGTNVGDPVTATDPDDDTLTYALTGTDAGSFTINSSTGQIMVGSRTTLDYETKETYMVTVTATDPDGASETIAVTIMVTDVDEPANNPPAFSADEATRSVAENMAPGTNVGDPVTATDPDGDTLTYALSGTDASSFTIDNTGQMTVGSGTTLDYETKETYMVTVTATDSQMATDTIDVTIMVTDVEEGVVERYDANGNGTIEKSEVIRAINDYLFPPGGVEIITKADVIKLINLYLFPPSDVEEGVVERYDANGNGTIEKSEVIKAINDYLFPPGGVEIITKADVIKLINLYLFG